MIRTLTAVALAGLSLLVSAFAFSQESAITAAPEVANDAVPALTRALQEVQPDRISADLHFIASDAMAGRYTPSKELEVAAHFLRSRLQRLGFEPGAGDGYFYEYPLVSNAIDAAGCNVEWSNSSEKKMLALARDYYFGAWRVSESATVSGPITSIGEGSDDDLEGLDLTGCWALMLDHEGRSTRNASRNTGKLGAIGLIVVQSSDYSGDPLEERFGGNRLDQLIQGSPRFPREDGESPRRSSPPIVFLQGQRGVELLAACAGSTGAKDWFPKAGSETGITLSETKSLQAEDGTLMVKNVCGLWPGRDPELAKEVILVTAHYDHVGRQGGKIHPGADDNGSGTSGLLAVAEALKAYGPMQRSVLVMWVSGEERGLWGSKAWSNNPLLPDGYRAVADLNIDMIGRNASNQLFITPTEEHEQFNLISRAAMRLSPLEGFPKLESADEFYHRSDQAEFARLGIPVAFFFAGVHEDYHQPTDTPDKIDYDKLSRVVRLVVRLLDELQSLPQLK